MRLLELIQLAESGLPAEEFWCNALTNQMFVVSGSNTSHAGFVLRNPQKFGLTPEQVLEARNDDLVYDLLFSRLKAQGWVRVGTDPKNRYAFLDT